MNSALIEPKLPLDCVPITVKSGLTPKYRKKLLFGQIRRHRGTLFHELASRKECKIREGHGNLKSGERVVKLLVTMGDRLDAGFGRILLVDLDSEAAEVVLEWLPPPQLRTSGKGFTGITWLGLPGQSDLIVCAYSALCRVNPKAWIVTDLLHQPCMNDLHHVAVHDGRLLVSNTGLNRIDVFAISGRFVGSWDMSPAWISDQRPESERWNCASTRDWNTRDSTTRQHEPFPASLNKNNHYVHPNHIAVLEGRPLVTRFLDRSIQDLADWSFAVPATPGHPHDGVLHNDRFWITCTTGLIVAYAVENGRVTSREIERIDIPEQTGRCGWCRGLFVTEETIIVGLTAVTYVPPFGWSNRDLSETETSIIAINRNTLKVASLVELRLFGQLPKIYGMVELPTS